MEKAVQNLTDQDALLFGLMLYTGRRFSDIRLLRWEDVKDRRIMIREKKTGKLFPLAISPKLREILDKYRQDCGYILHAKQGKSDTPLTIQGANHRLKRICLKLGLEPQNASTHFLRKTFATHVRNTHGLESACLILNHSSIQQTKRYIGDLSEEINNIYDSL